MGPVGEDDPERYALGGGSLPADVRDVVESLVAGGGGEREVHAAIADALVAGLPTDADGVTDWRGAGPYLRENLAGHAVRGGVLDRLVIDPGFLLAAEPALLLPALEAVSGAEPRAAAEAYRRAMAYLRDGPGPAASALQLAARRTGAERLADRIAYLGGLPWSTRWMLARAEPPHRTLAAVPGPVAAVWTGYQPDGVPVAGALSSTGAYGCWELSGGERTLAGTFGAWDMADGFVQVTLQRESAAVDVACVAPPGGPVLAVTVNQRGQVEVSDVDTGETRHRFVAPAADALPGTGSYRPPGQAPPVDEGESLRAVAAAVTSGGAIAVAVGHRGWLHRWDVVAGRELGRTFVGRTPEAVACTDLGGRTVAVVATGNNLMVFDLVSGEAVADHRVVVGELLRRMDVVGDIVAAVDTAERLHRWRLTAGGAAIEALAEPAVVHDDDVWAISCGRLPDGRPAAVTGSVDGAVRMWDLTDARLLHHIPVEDRVRTVVLTEELDVIVGMYDNLAVFRYRIS